VVYVEGYQNTFEYITWIGTVLIILNIYQDLSLNVALNFHIDYLSTFIFNLN